MNKTPSKLLAGAEAFCALLASIETLSKVVIEPASDSSADKQAAYAGLYAEVDKAVSLALDEYGDSAGFRCALGNHLLSAASGVTLQGAWAEAEEMLTDSGYRAMPQEPAEVAVDGGRLRCQRTGTTSAMAPAQADAMARRRNELVDRMPVLLCVLLDEIAKDTGDNPATLVLTEVLQEAACELQEIRDEEAANA